MEKKQSQNDRISPDSLLAIIGKTAADNEEGYTMAIPWKSRFVGDQIKMIFKYHDLLKSISGEYPYFGPLALATEWQSQMMESMITGPIKAHARIAAKAGRNPDIFGDMNGWIYKNYARELYSLTGYFMKNGHFDRKKARLVSSTPDGQEFLKNYMEEFAHLERSYNSIGLTRLKAMKDLLKCLLMIITEKPLENETLPFMDENCHIRESDNFSRYLEQNRTRMENLFKEKAFDLKEFSEWKTLGKIGFSRYEEVQGSQRHTVRLRYYPLPKGVKPNGKVLYMATPLINKPEIFDLTQGKSVVEGMLKEGFHIYLVDHGDPGPDETKLGLDFYGKTIPDLYLNLIKKRHPGEEIHIMAYCMAGTIILPYLARRAEERLAQGEPMDVKKLALMASPVVFDDEGSGHGPMREVIRRGYDSLLMRSLYEAVNIPSQLVEAGMNEIQPGVQYTVALGFYGRAYSIDAIHDSAHFLYWLTHGTKFPARAHQEWIENIYMGNQLVEGTYSLPSTSPAFDCKPVNMKSLKDAGVRIFCYRGTRDPIAPPGSCKASELWGAVDDGNLGVERGALNRTIEKNVGHIFVVSKKLLAEYLQLVNAFFRD
jgi:poly(3-hydroxyalkanoate) synthetase